MSYYWKDIPPYAAYIDEDTGEIVDKIYVSSYTDGCSYKGKEYVDLESAKRALELEWKKMSFVGRLKALFSGGYA